MHGHCSPLLRPVALVVLRLNHAAGGGERNCILQSVLNCKIHCTVFSRPGRDTRTCRGVCHSCGSTVARAVLTSAPPSSPLPSVVVAIEPSGAGPMGVHTVH